jgi:adenylate cyclase
VLSPTGRWIKRHERAADRARPTKTEHGYLTFLYLPQCPGAYFHTAVQLPTKRSRHYLDSGSTVGECAAASVENANNLINPAASALRVLAQMAVTDVALFKSEQSRELLYRALISTPQVDAVYVSFDDECERVVTRIDDDHRRSDPRIPPSAVWHSSCVDAFPAVRTAVGTGFFSTPGRMSSGTIPSRRRSMSPRCQPARPPRKPELSRSTGPRSIRLNPDTGSPVLSLAFPIERDGNLIACSGANMTLSRGL